MSKQKSGRCRTSPPSRVRTSLRLAPLLLILVVAPLSRAGNPQPVKQTTSLRTADYRLRLTKENIVALQAAQPASGSLLQPQDGSEPERITSRKALPLKLLDSSRGARLEQQQAVDSADKESTPPIPGKQEVTQQPSAQADNPAQIPEVSPTAPESGSLELTPSDGEPAEASEAATAGDKPVSSKSHLSDASPSAESKGECPGAPVGQPQGSAPQPEDIPLSQEEHPYDAPPATSVAQEEPSVADAPGNRFTARELEIQAGINNCLAYFLEHPETVVRRGPWALMHAVLPFGVETDVIAGSRRVNAIGWMCYNGVCARQRMFQPTRSGFRTNVGPGVQGHEGQFLAILAQSRVPASYPIKISNRQYTVADLVRYEMATCREKSELTFKLIGLSYYLQPDQSWRDNRGRSWNLEKVVAEEMAQPVNGAACGGTHRLMGLSYAIIERQRRGGDITGNWALAEGYLNDYINYTMSLQNPDGSFSTNWFEGRGNQPDVERKVQTTGHMLEWLIYTLPDEHLRSPRIQQSVEYLLNTVGAQPTRDWPIGPRGHALRALALYNQRVFGAEVGKLRTHLTARQAAAPLR